MLKKDLKNRLKWNWEGMLYPEIQIQKNKTQKHGKKNIVGLT